MSANSQEAIQDIGELKEEFVRLMRMIHREQFHPAWSPGNLSKPEMHTLMCVWIAYQHNKEARPSSLAKYSHVSPSAVSQTLKTLEGKGLVARVRSANDSRSVVIELTEEGRALIEEIQSIRSSYFDEMFEAIGVDDMQTLMRIMRRVLDFCALKHDVYAKRNVCKTDRNEFLSSDGNELLRAKESSKRVIGEVPA
ncbi:transcriptional regulator MarR family [Eggerthella sp. CAG:1427]|nr:transcriptional regulator MarR family [Eggerthella sp. CAG:1427]